MKRKPCASSRRRGSSARCEELGPEFGTSKRVVCNPSHEKLWMFHMNPYDPICKWLIQCFGTIFQWQMYIRWWAKEQSRSMWHFSMGVSPAIFEWPFWLSHKLLGLSHKMMDYEKMMIIPIKWWFCRYDDDPSRGIVWKNGLLESNPIRSNMEPVKWTQDTVEMTVGQLET